MKAIVTTICLFVTTLRADIIMKPYLMGVTKNSVYVLVECNSTATVTVEYGQTVGYGSSATTESIDETSFHRDNPGNGHTYVHKIKLTGLSQSTVYHYRARQGSDFQDDDSPDAYFTTAPEMGESFRFAWESDLRKGTDPPHDGTDVHNTIASRILLASPKFLLQGGDVCLDSTYDSIKDEFFLVNKDTSYELELISHVPFFWTVGPSHDVTQDKSTAERIDTTNFLAFSTNPSNSLGDTLYYSFDYGDLHVVVLNSVFFYPIGLEAPDHGWYERQYNFAKADLSATTQKWKIVVAHIPAYSSGQNGNSPGMIKLTEEVFIPKGVDLVISAHDHNFQHNYKDGLHHIIIGSAGAPLYPSNGPLNSAEYTVTNAKSYCYGIFDITPNTFTMNVYNEDGNQLDELILTKIDTWIAYNDLAWGSGQLEPNLPLATRKYITRITSPNGESNLLSSGYLMDYENGTFTSIKLTVSGGSFNGGTHANNGQDTADGDASVFNNKISPRGAVSYNDDNLELTLSGMGPTKWYEVIFYADRGDYGWIRASKVKIDCGSSDDRGAFINESSIGTDDWDYPLFSGPYDDDTRLPANNENGYVAKFTNISSGDDGVIKLIVSFDGTDSELRGKYASALFVKQLTEPIPVELSTFIASIHGRNVNLIWQTATEVNTFGFEIQRRLVSEKLEESHWVKIGFVQGSGNSNLPKEYRYIDKKLNIGKYAYRLKIVDYDGTFEYSSVISVEVGLPREYAISQNYPNPFNPITKMDYQLPFASKVTIELFTITGERVAILINNELSAGYYMLDINADTYNLSSGTYICRMVAKDLKNHKADIFIKTKKLMLIK